MIDPIFFLSLLNTIEEINSSQNIVIAGDFNLIFDKELDSTNYKNLNNPKSRLEVLKLMDALNLKDVYRENNPNLKRFTWRRKNPIKQVRHLGYSL